MRGLPPGKTVGGNLAARGLYEHAIQCRASPGTCACVGCHEMRIMFAMLRRHTKDCPEPDNCQTCSHAQTVRDAMREARVVRKPRPAAELKLAAQPSDPAGSALMMLARSALGELNSPYNSPCSSPRPSRP